MELPSEQPWLGMEKHPGWSSSEEASEASLSNEVPLETQTSGKDLVALRRSPSIDSSLSTIDEAASVAEPPPPPAPTGELTIAAICAPGVPWSRRLLLVTATLAINIGLPFLNGVMLGFGEIFARAFIAPWIGLAPPVPMSRLSASPADVPPMASIPPTGVRSWFVRPRTKDER
ncbi:Similar to S.cerevisiae protein MIM1 (Mitochondrial protein required for outer membrane protein import) [Malassezia sympodialis ATCC 42132]|uniref:Similar to S.cerevisiae protein MIM1 (Mitochondrial protein required for outer membrane protein import) n=1 Tax=Malassezia sympodialis (strain ATCC 42132) TaxID=1230383 RepID=A0A1M8A3Z6_MALS4|nr:Similar to S.cerevisiae protein MIM1 (Mitochondrial protein required for outer membrane protein import) [Malassezia sympodialis ATCC 42132]